jgi:hypothetical protein
MTEIISEKEGEKKRVCPNTVFQSIFMVDKPSAFAKLKESRVAYLNGPNVGILYETHSCLFMSHCNAKRGECLEEEMRVSCRMFFSFAARSTAHCNKCEMTSEVRRLQPRK